MQARASTCHHGRQKCSDEQPQTRYYVHNGVLQSIILRVRIPAWVDWGVNNLAFLRRPAIGFGSGAAHQHCAFTVSQAFGQAEGLDGLFVVADREGAGPVGAP
jgi:hypothetical protein